MDGEKGTKEDATKREVDEEDVHDLPRPSGAAENARGSDLPSRKTSAGSGSGAEEDDTSEGLRQRRTRAIGASDSMEDITDATDSAPGDAEQREKYHGSPSKPAAGPSHLRLTESPTHVYRGSLWHLDTLNDQTYPRNGKDVELEPMSSTQVTDLSSPASQMDIDYPEWITTISPKEKTSFCGGCLDRFCPPGDGNTYACCDERGTLLLKAIQKHVQIAYIKFRNRPWIDNLAIVFPCIVWMKGYKFRQYLWFDVVSGLSVGAMIIPQSMSYATIAGLPTQYGLYASFVPIFAYAIFGSSRQLAVGPVALVSLLVYSGLSDFVDTDDEGNIDQSQYNIMAVQLAFLAGLSQFILGFLRFGFIVNFLSHAVISGFTTGAAIIIGLSQIGGILGYKIKKTSGWPGVAATLYNIFKNIGQFNYKTFLMGTGFIVMLLTFKHLGKTYPRLAVLRTVGPITAAAIGIIITWPARLDEKGIPIVGDIPKGMPPVTVDTWGSIKDLGKMIVTALSISLVGFLESIAIAKNLAAKNNYEINANQELTGLGLANFLGAAFSSYPVTGSFSRSAVNNDTGAKTGLSGIVTGFVVLLVLLVLAPVLKWLPINVLSAIVISSVIGLLDYEEAIFLWKSDLRDFFIWTIALLGTLFLGVEIGLLIAVGISLLFVIYESAYPHMAVLGQLPGTQIYRNVKQYADAEQAPGVLVLRIDAPIYFANVAYVKDRLRKYELRSHSLYGVPLSFVVLELGPVTHMDSTALHALCMVQKEYKLRSVQLVLANPGSRVLKQLDKGGVIELIGRENVFVRSFDAVEHCKAVIGGNYNRPMGQEAAATNGVDTAADDDSSLQAESEGKIAAVMQEPPRQRLVGTRSASTAPTSSRRTLDFGGSRSDTDILPGHE